MELKYEKVYDRIDYLVDEMIEHINKKDINVYDFIATFASMNVLRELKGFLYEFEQYDERKALEAEIKSLKVEIEKLKEKKVK